MTFRNGEFESHGYDDWQTPQWLLDYIVSEYGEYFDPCPANPTVDGLKIHWSNHKVNFVNPPYSEMKEWLKKCQEQFLLGGEVIALIPPRIDTRYFHQYVAPSADLILIKGRLKFIDGRNPDAKPKAAPFPSILAHYHRRSKIRRFRILDRETLL